MMDSPTCPLCMELIEFDDVSFYPCQCGYQICRFCWHRIRTNENGLCPACRKTYSSSPDRFLPITYEQHKREQKKIKKKVAAAESRRSLVDLRVIQRNLIFVIGLSARIATVEELKKSVHFGKYGKILKVVVSGGGQQQQQQSGGQTSSAYITYATPSEALRAIRSTNNIVHDGKLIKSSLGTTKYCSYYLKGLVCTKAECMYLHSLGEEEASFTKEEMLLGKHTEYERKLMEEFEQGEQGGRRGEQPPPPTTTIPLPPTASAAEHPQPSPPPAAPPDYPDYAECKFDPFVETNSIFEELIQIHANGAEGAARRDPTPTHPPGFANWFTPPPPPQQQKESDWIDPAIIFSQLYAPAQQTPHHFMGGGGPKHPPPPGFH